MKISSQATFYVKRIFPTIWFGFVAAFFVAGLGFGGIKQSLIFLIAPLILAVGGYFMMKHLLFDLADEVWMQDDSLQARKGKKSITIPYSDIKNVSYINAMSPPRVTLSLRSPSELGDEVSFVAPVTLNPFKKSQLIEELITRADESR